MDEGQIGGRRQMGPGVGARCGGGVKTVHSHHTMFACSDKTWKTHNQ